ncbi:SHOCT domain-containing protein [Zavarzinia compransoris]|uniref:SHOCT domain-containing protein n=1 Tax=Zavarzinia marina TaxID=2911065 RepID=UPI001F3A288A|nr:SHOCT domain-containing protein [Zavarzinia marina]MCF4165276.1 SHOCT domain-containing protein [Zavarzinia marina]
MRQLSQAGQQAVGDIAQRHGFSADAVTSMLMSVVNGNGSMAQFDHPEFGGSGQWMQGGMIMLSDMFNNALKGRIDALCNELASLAASQPGLLLTGSFQSQSQGGYGQGGYGNYQSQDSQPNQGGYQSQSQGGGAGVSLFVPGPGQGSHWWPADLGQPNSSGAQNNVRYAWFAGPRRLAIDLGGHVTVYDTMDHSIGGFSQQQSGSGTLSFTSQYGLIDVASLPVVSGGREAPAAPRMPDAAPPMPEVPAPATIMPEVPPPAPQEVPVPTATEIPAPDSAGLEVPAPASPAQAAPSAADIIATIEKLAALRDKGILSDAEFAAKKAELLSRL